MNTAKRLCLNMIVKNEMANLGRCLGAVADHIECWVIGDTGSTDGTQNFIRSFFDARNIPGELHEFPFHNFEQARNAALEHAYASSFDYDYLLFDDADMELVVEDHSFRERLDAPGYRVLQRSESGLAYWNTRLVSRTSGARYHGVTHEYVEVPGGVQELGRVWYKDHATGSNRVDKFERDIKLLLAALDEDPENHRYWFYLAQSYRDAGRTAEAAVAYAKRAAMGGWDEEAWNARLQEARCLKKTGDDAGFIHQALAAFNARPQRAEPLYDLAHHYREKGMNDASVLFSEAGLPTKRPEQDILFIEDYVYTAGLREEYSIAANYARDPARKDRGFAACNWLALNREIGDAPRDLARSNLYFYLRPANAIMPSFKAQRIEFAAPEGYVATSPSVARLEDGILVLQPTVNPTLTNAGQYATPGGAPITTRNFLLRLDSDLVMTGASEVLPPTDLPEPAYHLALGFEDMRLFAWRDKLWGLACVRQLTPEGWCEQVLARIEAGDLGSSILTDWRVIRPAGQRRHEKNWMPLIERTSDGGDRLRFVYRYDPTKILDENGRTVSEHEPMIAAAQFSGASQGIWFDGGWLALIHEAGVRPNENRRHHQHRFVWFDDAHRLAKLSRPFYFHDKGLELAAGLAWHPDAKRLMISYGVGDADSWIATVQADEVAAFLDDTAGLPSGLTVADAGVKPTLPLISHGAEDADWIRFGSSSRPYGGDAPAEPRSFAFRSGRTAEEFFRKFAPFLEAVDSPAERCRQSRNFDRRILPFLNNGAALPQIHCFYEVLSDKVDHSTLIAATTSMMAAGHPVRVWSYSPNRLEFLLPHGIAVSAADDVMPRTMFERIVASSEIRYFSDIFRYAVLYEHGGLWMDSDIVMLRPFPFSGDHFFNLQWRGSHKGHFVCGNVIYAKPYSRHLRALYEMSIERFHAVAGKEFGDIGPKLLSDYIASDAGSELHGQVFSPMFFNSIDWTETDRFERPITELADYLNDDRVFGVHLWTARNEARPDEKSAAFIAQLIRPLEGFPAFTTLADKFNTDKNRHTGNRHYYARIYDRLLSSRRLSLRRLMEIGLCRVLADGQSETPSVSLWQSYFPFCQVIGIDLTDFSRLNNERFKSFVCDQSNVEGLRRVAAKLERASFDAIIDDGSHASFDEQLTLREFFPLLAEDGWYFIEDLDWQPPGEDPTRITPTKALLREIKECGIARSADPLGVSTLAGQFAEILFFDSHYELDRAQMLGGLVAIRKRATLRVT
ncbi:glycosyltransferase [Mesorhizobium sp.]|uniref:glycosyltransferase n=1 Tax=Mesorhizobium sp. TaxID=1871066 RepID=UPI000FE403FB|nr:glycosyltransferase [Mesorhizobium sp.]RWH69252.1 MAG: glycosyltransferase [Mesorhizobium sp.]RWL27740.1 MAG: glycosyltransferase [Mesorhizobium sp.]RWL29048.1 MAG: glycosyltransferase [Mesorhizobium sp.]RWL34832.1 MAG: glycosyltransferase [Mesorhizobium sp.]RWL46325.1 MAG: glycosyltransferase [Mesorhizobium sp.]